MSRGLRAIVTRLAEVGHSSREVRARYEAPADATGRVARASHAAVSAFTVGVIVSRTLVW